MDEKLREKTTKVLASQLGCTEEIAENILKGMDKEAKKQQEESTTESA